jgi:hypothetical protein
VRALQFAVSQSWLWFAQRTLYRRGLAGYGRLLQGLAEAHCQSCLVLTLRELLPELATLSAESGSVRALGRGALSLAEGPSSPTSTQAAG